MASRWIVLDVASAPLANAADFIDKSAIEAPSNYKKPEAIAGYIEEEYASRVARAGLDLDLARITAIGMAGEGYAQVNLCRTEDDERQQLTDLALALRVDDRPTLVTYGGFHFDLPLLMRRSRYLGVNFPTLNLDRYKSPHLDLLLELSDRDPSRRRSLSFYCRRLGWSDLCKTLSGAEEAQVFTSGRWEDLQASVEHDVEATRRLASWMGHLR